jgi:pimeloyl-ACP methyl ester carboxylesterase
MVRRKGRRTKACLIGESDMSALLPFEIVWEEAAVADVLRRVREVRLPPAPKGSGWAYGCDADFLERLREHWLTRYDWRAAAADLNRHPQALARMGDADIHVVRVQGEGERRRPLLLTHGWPGSHFEFWQAIEPLAFPSRHGGRAEDAFDLVIPTLPGYGYSGKPERPVGPRWTAALWNRLMTEVLGHERYLAQGGDWGAIVTTWLGRDHAASVAGIHLNMAPFRPARTLEGPEEQAWAERADAARAQMSAYSFLQMTKPQSLAWAAADNPLGQAAWIIERFHDWADLTQGDLEQVFGLDRLITNVMLYVMTGSFPTAAWFYAGLAAELAQGAMLNQGRVEVPTAVAAHADRIMPPPPRSALEEMLNIVQFSRPARGGHFAAMEQPAAFVEDVRAFGRVVWPTR